MKPEEFFTSKQQLARYHYAVEIAKKLKNYQDDGYFLFDEHNDIITGEIVYNTEFDKNQWDVVSIKETTPRGSSLYIQIDLEYDEMGYPWICSKKSIKEAFVGFSAIHPKDVKKIIL